MESEALIPQEMVCGLCGEKHAYTECGTITVSSHIKDKKVPSRAQLSLPDGLQVVKMADGSCSVQSLMVIQKGTKFGPFEAKQIFTIHPAVSFPLKIFNSKDEYFKEYYLDNSNEADCNWMYFVQTASVLEEQNLVCFEHCSEIYFLVIRNIDINDYLKVWYSDYYGKLMNAKTLESEVVNITRDFDVNSLVMKNQDITERAAWTCKFCGKPEETITSFAKHIREHYIMQLRKVCELCKQSFQTRKSLKKHMFFVHSNVTYATHIDLEKGRINNNKKTADTAGIGGPLLNEIDSMENSNVLLDHVLPPFEMVPSNLEIDSLNLGVDNILQVHETFDFPLPDNLAPAERFCCDICPKSFSKLRLLIVHMAAHTGDFVCGHCKTVFTRNENFLSHNCNKKLDIKCDLCDQRFTLKKYLTRHISLKHKQQFICHGDCKKVFPSQKTLDAHACSPEKVTFPCTMCTKEFYCSKNLNRHLRVHYAKAIREKQQESNMCDICSKQFATKKHLTQHMTSHSDSHFVCQVCCKKFTRKDVYLDHIRIHKGIGEYECPQCRKKFSVKKYLTKHMLIHNAEYKHRCSVCGQKFRQRSNLTTHYGRVHSKRCMHCDESFKTVEEMKEHAAIHFEKCFQCPLCDHIVKLKSSLARHLKRKHSQESCDLANVKTIDRRIEAINEEEEEEEEDNEDDNHCDIADLLSLREGSKDDDDVLHDIDSNLERYIGDGYDTNLIPGGPKNLDGVLDFNSLEMEFEKNIRSNATLSMPELDSLEQNLLGDNAYLGSNDAIDQSKMLLYILDHKDQSK